MENKTTIDTKIEESKAVNGFITDAIAKSLPVETMEKLFTLREKVKAEYAKEEFMKAMSSFQKDCPVIEKKNPVTSKSGQIIYHFANLGDIVEQVKKPLGDNNLSYDFLAEDLKDFLKITCTVTHALGYSKSSSFQIPIGVEAYMTDVQKYGARVTFAKRYAFCNALGILTNDEDVDAKDEEVIQIISKELIESISNAKNNEELKVIWDKNKGLGKEFASLVTKQKKFLAEVSKNENGTA